MELTVIYCRMRRPGRADAFGFRRTGLRAGGSGTRLVARSRPHRILSVTDQQALEAARTLARTEGIIPALESAHAVAETLHRAPSAKGELFIMNLSGRGDKDTDIYRENLKELDDLSNV